MRMHPRSDGHTVTLTLLAVAGQPLQRCASRVAQAEEPGALVERLAGRVVQRLPQHLVVRAVVKPQIRQPVAPVADFVSLDAGRGPKSPAASLCCSVMTAAAPF